MRVLLGSGGFRTPERITALSAQMRSFFGDIERLLFVPYALHDHDVYVRTLTDRGIHAGYRLDGLHTHRDPVQAIGEAPAVFVGGGNTFRLLDSLYRLNVLSVLRKRVRAGMPYLGISAGCNVACPSIRTTNDMPIVQPPSLEALGLVSFQINPHYFTGNCFIRGEDGFHEHFGETRDDRIREFHEMNDTPVLGLWEAGLLRIEGASVELRNAPARLFLKGQPPRDLEPGATLSELLQ